MNCFCILEHKSRNFFTHDYGFRYSCFTCLDSLKMNLEKLKVCLCSSCLCHFLSMLKFVISVSRPEVCKLVLFAAQKPHSTYSRLCRACMLAKLLHLCLTLCNPMDCSPTRLLCPWDFPGKNIGDQEPKPRILPKYNHLYVC